ncbi:hypothetical protein HX037_02675 [Ignatzschineria indica]|uniref:hypothetical protein n=1 Tax=Ignatzschineria indica TaxID=472583 RepID=UPI002577FFD4|nr:hypothetical protein [Ignatzschineria indica]MDM1544791.1 hypothetical protein [Ignatzschineria indica]
MEEHNSEIRQLNSLFASINHKIIGDKGSPTAGARFMEERNSEIRQLNSLFASINHKIIGDKR